MNNDSKRVALVTGGSRGLGLGIAQQLAERDFNLAINGRRDEQSVTEVLQQLRDSSTYLCIMNLSRPHAMTHGV